MNQADAEAHLPPVVLPEVNGDILPNYEKVDPQDLVVGSFYYMGGTGAAGQNGAFFAGPRVNNFLAEYEGMQGDNYIFTFYKTRSKVPLGPWIDDIEQGLDFPIANFQDGGLRLYTYNPGINQENMNMNGGVYTRFKSYKTRKALKKRGKKTRHNH